MPASSVRYRARPVIAADDIPINAATTLAAQRLVVAALEALVADCPDEPSAYFARGFTGAALGKEPASTLLVSVPFAGTETALELLVDLGGVVDDLIFMHTDRQGRFSARREDRQAIAEVAEMLEAQARRLRGVVAEVPGHG